MSPLVNFFFIEANCSMRTDLDEILADCSEAQAPICESFGLDEKYLRDSKFDIFSTLPIILTCLSKASHGKRIAA